MLKPLIDNATAENELCGSRDCPWNNVTAKAARPDQTTVIIVGLAIYGITDANLLDKIYLFISTLVYKTNSYRKIEK